MVKSDEYVKIMDEFISKVNKLMEKVTSEDLPKQVMIEELEKIKAERNQYMQKIQDECLHPETFERIYNEIRYIFCDKCLKLISVEKINK